MGPGRTARGLAALALGLACACAGTSRGERMLVTLEDFFASGQRELRHFLEEDESGALLREVLARARPAIVRVQGRSPIPGVSDAHSMTLASGVLLAGGRLVLTAGHGTVGAPDMRWTVMLADGRRSGARVLAGAHAGWQGRDDWALLELDEPLEGLAGVAALGRLAPGEPALVLAYPGGRGEDPAGRLVLGAPDQALPALALAHVARAHAAGDAELEPLAGSAGFSGGSSGGGVFNARGELVGLLIASLTRLEEAGMLEDAWALSPIEQLEGRLLERWSPPRAQPAPGPCRPQQ